MNRSKLFGMLLLSFLVIGLNACKNDEDIDNSTSKDKMTLNGKDYSITNVGINPTNMGDKKRVTFLLTGNNGSDILQGQVSILYPKDETIDGKYDANSSTRAIYTYESGYILTTTSGMVAHLMLGTGSATIKDNGDNNYTISFKMKPSTGTEIEGYYSGIVTNL